MKASGNDSAPQARRIYIESAIAALILTVFSFFFASVLPETARSSRDMSLEQTADFLIRDGYAVLFGWVLQLRLFRNRDKTFVGGHRQLPGTPG